VPRARLVCPRKTGSFQEIGGLNPVVATGATVDRVRVLFVPRSGITGLRPEDFGLSRLRKFFNICWQNFSTSRHPREADVYLQASAKAVRPPMAGASAPSA